MKKLHGKDESMKIHEQKKKKTDKAEQLNILLPDLLFIKDISETAPLSYDKWFKKGGMMGNLQVNIFLKIYC